MIYRRKGTKLGQIERKNWSQSAKQGIEPRTEEDSVEMLFIESQLRAALQPCL